MDEITLVLNKPEIGAIFRAKGQSQQIISYLENLNASTALSLENTLKTGPAMIIVGSQQFQITPQMIKEFKKETKTVLGEQIIPAVIEPSFGIGRILYSILEHNYYTREDDEQRSVLSLPPVVAPAKVSVLPLLSNAQFLSFIPIIVSDLTDLGISSKVDDVGQAIGRRYARTDEIGIPFGITIDHDTITENTVTLRERDSTSQVRIKLDDVATVVKRLIDGKLLWSDVWNTYPQVQLKKEE